MHSGAHKDQPDTLETAQASRQAKSLPRQCAWKTNPRRSRAQLVDLRQDVPYALSASALLVLRYDGQGV